MTTKLEMEERLAGLWRDLRAVTSIWEMMKKSATTEDLLAMKREKIDPVQREIDRLEKMLKEDPK
jgi:hypothetical protein